MRLLRRKAMKKVFWINHRLFWACNGQRIRGLWHADFTVGSKKAWLKQFDRPRIQVEIVKPPAGRCPHCGEKL